MKIHKGLPFLFLVLLIFPFPVQAQGLPRPAGFVNDFAGVLGAEDREKLESFALSVKEKTGSEIAVVTIKSYAPYGSLEEYAAALFGEWGIGQKGKDDGVLLILAADDREVKIETGYGLEGALPDSVCGRILDRAVLPEFREGRFSAGLLNGTEAIAALIAREKEVDPASLGLSAQAEGSSVKSSRILSEIFFVVFILVFFIIIPLTRRRRGHFRNFRGPGPGGFGGGGFGGGSSFGGFGGGRSGGGGASRKF